MTISRRSVTRTCASLLVAAVFNSGCGGGGGGNSNPTPGPTPTPSPVNTAPVATAADLATQEDSPLTGTAAARDAESNTLTFAVSQRPASGAVSIDSRTGQFVYVPNANFFGNDEFFFTASDATTTSAPARVTIAVSAVNDPPIFQQFQAPAFGEARQLLSVTAQPVDVDGTIVRTEVTQADGTALPELSLRANGFDFRLPDTEEVLQRTYRVRAFDAEGNVVEREFTASILPLSASGNLTTLAGNARSSGLQWVITGDGFLASQRAALLQQAYGILDTTLGQPELAKHRSIWNVQVLSVASAESGADVPSANTYRDTAFDSTFDCGGLARLICLNWDKVYARVIPEFPDYDVLLVIVNSDLYGGSGGEQGAVTSSHPLAAHIMLHEMGHSFAGLGDEYADSDAERTRAGTYFEGRFPNITRFTDLARIPWRYWFQDPNNVPTTPGMAGIGRFEGAFYTLAGYYRPADDSFMRSSLAGMTVVHAEAWTRSIYRRIGPIVGSTPTEAALTLAADERRAFGVERRFPASVQAVRWYLDGQEVDSARDAGQMMCCAGITGTHVLRVDVNDISGVIRVPDATESRASRSWNLTIDPNLGAAVQPRKLVQPEPAGELVIRMRVDESGHHVEGISRVKGGASARHAPSPVNRADANFQFTVTDESGRALVTGDLGDPRVLRGPLPLPGEGEDSHAQLETAAAYYLIRAPEFAAIRYLRVEPRAGVLNKTGPAGPAHILDLAPFLEP